MEYSQLSDETRALLEAIRDDSSPIPARRLRLVEFRRLVTELAKPYLNEAGLLLVPYTLHLHFCATLAPYLLRYTGNVLFDELVAHILRWIGYGLPEQTLTGVLRTCYQGLRSWQPEPAGRQA
ncbi:MAG: hypothetical protein ABIK43_01715 [candidate division WOR-3 bacterium]